MRWSWKLGEFAGIGVYVHATFVLLIGFVALSHWLEDGTLGGVVAGVAFVLAIFTCVVLHEFGHALTARRYGIQTRDVTLLPIGGVARLERMPDDPRQELWVALAGPAVNVVIAVLLFVWLQLVGGLGSLGGITVTRGSFLDRLLVANLFLVGFNMLPAFPMDGGRVVRALLASRMDYVRATQIAATLGQGMAFLFGFIGFFTNPFLLFIAFFVWIGAQQEAAAAQQRAALGGIPVSSAMLTDFHTLSPYDPLGRAVELTITGSQKDFPVLDEERVVGVLRQSDLLVALAQQGRAVPVADVMARGFVTADAAEMLEAALARLQACDCRSVPVMRFGRLVGMLTLDNVGEYLMLQAAIESASRRGRGWRARPPVGSVGETVAR